MAAAAPLTPGPVSVGLPTSEAGPGSLLLLPPISAFGVLIRTHRIAASLSQNRVARLSGVDQAYINRIERGKQHSQISRDLVLSIAEALDLSMSETDRLLFEARLAPQSDYQALYEDAMRRLAAIDAALVGLNLTATHDDAMEARAS